MTDFDLQQMYNEMPFRKKVSLFLKQNHFLFWKITLMDVTIVVPLFVLVGYTLDRCSSLETGYAILIAAAVCSVIEYFRIRFRRIKTYRYVSEKIEITRKLIEHYSEAVERSGNEEDRQKVAEAFNKLEQINQVIEHMADIAYKEDVLGLSDEE